MEIALLVILFLIGSVGGAMQALKYVERRNPGRRAKHDDQAPHADDHEG